MAALNEGDTAPEFTLTSSEGNEVSLSDYSDKGRDVVIYFYPADDTPGCTKEACQFNDNLSALASSGCDVIGISPDDQESHRRFQDKYKLSLTLLSDPDHSVAERYGAWGEKTLYGRKTTGIIRSTFLVSADGIVRRSWYNVRADGHADKVLEKVHAERS
ncbi:MAG: thioredoxin-dependent thiol peroxidase [Acidimicrobiales bacterium]